MGDIIKVNFRSEKPTAAEKSPESESASPDLKTPNTTAMDPDVGNIQILLYLVPFQAKGHAQKLMRLAASKTTLTDQLNLLKEHQSSWLLDMLKNSTEAKWQKNRLFFRLFIQYCATEHKKTIKIHLINRVSFYRLTI